MAVLIITAIAQVHTEMTVPTPKPRPTRRLEMMKSWVLRTSFDLMSQARARKTRPVPIIRARPSPWDSPGDSVRSAAFMTSSLEKHPRSARRGRKDR